MKVIHGDDLLNVLAGTKGKCFAFDGFSHYEIIECHSCSRQDECLEAGKVSTCLNNHHQNQHKEVDRMPYEEIGRGIITKLDESNPVVEGTLVEIREGLYGPLFDIQTADGETVTLPSDTVLQTKITKNFIGKQIKIEFKGMIPSTRRKGKEYKDYSVFVMK